MISAYVYAGLPNDIKKAALGKMPYLDIDNFIDFYCNKEKLLIADIMRGGRQREYVTARHWVWWAYRKYTQENKLVDSLHNMGERFKKDHATVLHGIRNISNLVDVYPNTQAKKFIDYYNEITS